MSEYAVMPMSDYEGICDAVRAKTGGTAKLKSSEVKQEIEGIQTGSDPVIEPLTVTENGTYSAPSGVDGYNPVTVNVAGSGDTDAWNPPEEYTYFYDYDGTILYQYTVEETQALTELPPLPANVNHEGLVFEGWNWSLDDLKSLDYPMDVGALYNTFDGKGRLYITLASEDELAVTLNLYQGESGMASVDFGDGSDVEVVSETKYVSISHTYPTVGDYVISIENTNPSNKLYFGWGNSSYNTAVLSNRTSLTRAEYGGLFSTVYSFYLCSNLEVVVPSRNTYSAGTYGFSGCTKLRFFVVTPNDTAISKNSFENCSGLSGVSLANGFAKTSDRQFKNCTSLRRICFGNNITELFGSVLEGCTKLERAFYSDRLQFPLSMFYGCKALNWIELPSTLTSIPNGCFQDCNNIKNIKINSDIVSVGSYAFYNCYRLPITLDNVLTTVGSGAFYNCYGMKAKKIYLDVTNITMDAFRDCYGIEEVTFVSEPTSLATSVFTNCYNLKTINVPWAEGEVANAPWGATNATINYNYTGG